MKLLWCGIAGAADKGFRGVVKAPYGSPVCGDNWALLVGIDRYKE